MTEHPGDAYGEQLERELADLCAEDNSTWSYDASAGGYVSAEHDGVICRDAAAVAYHVGGDDGVTYQR